MYLSATSLLVVVHLARFFSLYCLSHAVIFLFQSRFERVETGSNIDAPEAGLDAMAQAALCDDQVGWRDSAVKMILYFTDDAFKFAGEGRVSACVMCDCVCVCVCMYVCVCPCKSSIHRSVCLYILYHVCSMPEL